MEPVGSFRSYRDVRALIATMCAVVLPANCTSSNDASSREEGRSIASPGSSSPIPDAGVFVRSCESSVSGDLGAGWRRDAVLAGPVAFVGARGSKDDPKTVPCPESRDG
jgi:hypothetical protein